MNLTSLTKPIVEGSAHIWTADLIVWRSYAERLRSLLSDEEKDRLARLKITNKREEFLCSRGILRIILSRYVTEDPKNLTVNYTSAGKPFLPGTGIQFNISHSKDFLLCGISLNKQIGLDIQEIYSISSLDRIINNFFSPAETRYLHTLPSGETYREHFFAIWTAKEAYLKAVGDGIQGSFNQISIIPESVDLQIFRLDLPGSKKSELNWTINSLEVSQGYYAALAYDGKLNALCRYEIAPEDIFNI